ncbi:hypothetical protein PU646_27570, partial [Klebsiella pneumoniae]
LLLCHGMVCVVGRMRDLILQLSKSSIYSTKPATARNVGFAAVSTGAITFHILHPRTLCLMKISTAL